jgi:hypothetical protein
MSQANATIGSEEQRLRLADIGERTPVTLVLKAGAPIRTTLG